MDILTLVLLFHTFVAAVIISTVYGFQTSVKIASAMTQIIIAANLLLLRTYLLVLPLFLKVCGDQLSTRPRSPVCHNRCGCVHGAMRARAENACIAPIAREDVPSCHRVGVTHGTLDMRTCGYARASVPGAGSRSVQRLSRAPVKM